MLLIKTTLLPTHQHQSLDMLLVIEKGNSVSKQPSAISGFPLPEFQHHYLKPMNTFILTVTWKGYISPFYRPKPQKDTEVRQKEGPKSKYNPQNQFVQLLPKVFEGACVVDIKVPHTRRFLSGLEGLQSCQGIASAHLSFPLSEPAASAELSGLEDESAALYSECAEILQPDFTFSTSGITFLFFFIPFSQIQRALAALSLVLYLVAGLIDQSCRM